MLVKISNDALLYLECRSTRAPDLWGLDSLKTTASLKALLPWSALSERWRFCWSRRATLWGTSTHVSEHQRHERWFWLAPRLCRWFPSVLPGSVRSFLSCCWRDCLQMEPLVCCENCEFFQMFNPLTLELQCLRSLMLKILFLSDTKVLKDLLSSTFESSVKTMEAVKSVQTLNWNTVNYVCEEEQINKRNINF